MVWVSLPWMNTAGDSERVVRSELASPRGSRGAPALTLPSSATRKSRSAMRPSREWARACRTDAKRETEGGTGRAPPPLGGVDLGVHLVLDPLLDHVGGEHIALEQEVVVRFQGPERLLERPGRGRDARALPRGGAGERLLPRLPPAALVRAG